MRDSRATAPGAANACLRRLLDRRYQPARVVEALHHTPVVVPRRVQAAAAEGFRTRWGMQGRVERRHAGMPLRNTDGDRVCCPQTRPPKRALRSAVEATTVGRSARAESSRRPRGWLRERALVSQALTGFRGGCFPAGSSAGIEVVAGRASSARTLRGRQAFRSPRRFTRDGPPLQPAVGLRAGLGERPRRRFPQREPGSPGGQPR